MDVCVNGQRKIVAMLYELGKQTGLGSNHCYSTFCLHDLG